mmetsp:Transcript_22502/g.53347  ORF Transcript_22502/g.53347 Transcript_22502/m.53347 type:complete len:382 (-) Transcript_22502:463-1608(-)
MQPAVLVFRRCCLLRVFVVALEDVGPTQTNLAARNALAGQRRVEVALERYLGFELLFRGRVAVGALVRLGVLQLDLEAWDRSADVSARCVSQRHRRGHACVLCEAVALDDRTVEHHLEKAMQVWRERGSASCKEPEPPSEPRLDFLEEKSVRDEFADAQEGIPGLGVSRHAPLIQAHRHAPALLQPLDDFVVHARVNAGHAGHNCRAQHRDVFAEEAFDVARVEADCTPRQDRAHLHAGLEGVREGQEREVDVIALHQRKLLVLVQQRPRARQKVPVRQNHSLRVPGRSGGVHDVRPVPGVRVRDVVEVEALSKRHKFRERVESEPLLRHARLLLRRHLLPDDDVLEPVCLTLCDVEHLLLLARNRRQLRVLDDELHGVLA